MKKRGQMPKSTTPHSTFLVCLEKGTALFILDHILSLNCPPPMSETEFVFRAFSLFSSFLVPLSLLSPIMHYFVKSSALSQV